MIHPDHFARVLTPQRRPKWPWVLGGALAGGCLGPVSILVLETLSKRPHSDPAEGWGEAVVMMVFLPIAAVVGAPAGALVGWIIAVIVARRERRVK